MIRNLRELYQYRALLWSLTLRELKARYRASVLGFLWTFLNPTLQMAVYTLVFGYLGFGDRRIEHYPYFIFVGMLPWIYFSTSAVAGASSISDRRDLLTKVRFPAQVLPATIVFTNLLNYLFSLPLMFILCAVAGHSLTWHVVFFIPLVILQTLFTLAMTYLLSALNVAFRDLQHIVNNLLMVAFFGSFVLMPMEPVHEKYPLIAKIIVYGNPMAALTIAYRDIFYTHQIPNWHPLAAVALIAIMLLWISSVIFERRREEFAELV
jgi:lipopolysaccharide transport system permease protein